MKKFYAIVLVAVLATLMSFSAFADDPNSKPMADIGKTAIPYEASPRSSGSWDGILESEVSVGFGHRLLPGYVVCSNHSSSVGPVQFRLYAHDPQAWYGPVGVPAGGGYSLGPLMGSYNVYAAPIEVWGYRSVSFES